MSVHYLPPPGLAEYDGPPPRFFGVGSVGSIEIPKAAPSYVLLNAYRTAREAGWTIVPPTTEQFDTTMDLRIVGMTKTA